MHQRKCEFILYSSDVVEKKKIILFVTLIQGRMNNGLADGLIQKMKQPNANK